MSEARELWTQADISQVREREWVHFLDPEAVIHFRPLGARAGLRNLGVQLVRIQPGFASSEPHRHYHEEEMVYILSGQGTLLLFDEQLNAEQHAVGPGDFIGFPTQGRAHTIRNTGQEDLLYLCVGQRLERETVDYPRRAKRLYVGPQGLDMVEHQHIVDPLRGG